MSENPNPTRCGACGTLNPPGAEVCRTCHAPLTITADADSLADTPEALDNPAKYDPDPALSEGSEAVVVGGIGGAPIPVPAKSLDPDPDRPSRD